MLQVLDLANLHPGIDQYYRDHHRTKPLNLVHYTGDVAHRALIEPLQCLWKRYLLGAFNKEKALVGAFSGHCETSQRFVASSNKH